MWKEFCWAYEYVCYLVLCLLLTKYLVKPDFMGWKLKKWWDNNKFGQWVLVFCSEFIADSLTIKELGLNFINKSIYLFL